MWPEQVHGASPEALASPARYDRARFRRCAGCCRSFPLGRRPTAMSRWTVATWQPRSAATSAGEYAFRHSASQSDCSLAATLMADDLVRGEETMVRAGEARFIRRSRRIGPEAPPAPSEYPDVGGGHHGVENRPGDPGAASAIPSSRSARAQTRASSAATPRSAGIGGSFGSEFPPT